MIGGSKAEIPLISVIIPVRNGEDTIGACLQAIFSQSLADRIEVVLIDSGSTDGTIAIAREWPVQILPIDPAAFNHGLTRNLGVEQARGEFVYLTVQDARLAAADVLERMVLHFRDEQVMGVCGNQAVPHEADKNPVYWHHPISAPSSERYQFPDPILFMALPAEERARFSAWDNVNAMYRRVALQQIPFIQTDFAEDLFWAKSALEKGRAIIRDSGAITWHYHHRNFSYAFRSGFILHYSVYLFFKILPAYPSFFKTLRVILARLWKEPSVGLRSKLYWFFHSLADFFGVFYAAMVFRNVARSGDEKKIKQAYQHYCRNIPMGRLKGR